MKKRLEQYFRYSFLIISALTIMLACSTNKELSNNRKTANIPAHWKCKIISTDVSSFPEVRLKAVVLDENNNLVLNLAPPFGYADDWQDIWTPIMAEHPKWGCSELIDFKVTEYQFNGIDSSKLVKLNAEKDSLISEIINEEKKLLEYIKIVESRKQNRDPGKIDQEHETSLVFVMDISGSMNGEPLDKTKRAAIEFLRYSDAEIAIVAFDNQIYPIMDFSHNHDSLVKSFLNLETIGGTQLYDALIYALNMLSEKSKCKHIIALTDGQTSGDLASLNDVINKALDMNTSIDAKTGDSVNIFTIGYNYENDDLIKVSEQTGGQFYKVASDTELMEAFSDYLGYDLEFTFPDISLHHRLNEVKKEIEFVRDSIYENYHYEISFKLPFNAEDGLEQVVSLRFARQQITHPIQAPVSTTEFVLQGYITDDITIKSIPDASIVINPQRINNTFTCKSDTTGYYEILVDKVDGKYSVIIYADDYFIVSEEHNLAKKEDYYIQFNKSLPQIEKDEVVSLRTIHFENNEFIFEPNSFGDLLNLANYFLSHPEFIIEVAGHTDSYGSASYNQWLSERRAETVAEFIKGLGFPETNISSKGYGESQRLVPDNSPENRYINRRVEIKLVEILDDIR